MLTIVKPFIKTCKDNCDFIEISNKFDILNLNDENMPKEVKIEIEWFRFAVENYEIKNRTLAKNFAIRKDSVLGVYILSLIGKELFDADEQISFNKVVNALNIAIFENNPIAKELIKPFQNQVSGSKNQMIDQYGIEVVNYILKYNNFKIYLQKLNGEYHPDEYLLYENGCLSGKTLLNLEKQKAIK